MAKHDVDPVLRQLVRAVNESGQAAVPVTVHGTTPKYSSIAVQHCTALTVTSSSFIQVSMTWPSFAILSRASLGTLAAGVAHEIEHSGINPDTSWIEIRKVGGRKRD